MPPGPSDDTAQAAVVKVESVGDALVAVTVDLFTGRRFRVLMSRSIATYDNVTFTANALAQLVAVDRTPL